MFHDAGIVLEVAIAILQRLLLMTMGKYEMHWVLFYEALLPTMLDDDRLQEALGSVSHPVLRY